jgi:hypothetical protein
MAGIVVADAWKNGDGTENYRCRAWVNFNGTGTVAIRASGNVSSITDNGVGDYTVNFTAAMPDANYSAPISAGGQLLADATWDRMASSYDVLTAGIRFRITNSAAVLSDVSHLTVAIFR